MATTHFSLSDCVSNFTTLYNGASSTSYTTAYAVGRTLSGGCTATNFETTWTNGLCWLVIGICFLIFVLIYILKFINYLICKE